jgi:hypothetical protein
MRLVTYTVTRKLRSSTDPRKDDFYLQCDVEGYYCTTTYMVIDQQICIIIIMTPIIMMTLTIYHIMMITGRRNIMIICIHSIISMILIMKKRKSIHCNHMNDISLMITMRITMNEIDNTSNTITDVILK